MISRLRGLVHLPSESVKWCLLMMTAHASLLKAERSLKLLRRSRSLVGFLLIIYWLFTGVVDNPVFETALDTKNIVGTNLGSQSS